jgi:multidrug resistance efflux pump
MKKRWLILAVLAAAAAGGAVWASRRSGKEKPVVLSGSIEARDVEVGSLMGGRVARVLVEEGATVKTGQPLVVFETDLIDLQIAQQRARIAQSRANLAKSIHGPRTEEIARARAASENAERERQRQQALLRSGISGQQAYDAAATAAKTAAETLREAERGSRPEDIDAARAQLDADERQLAYLQRQRQETTVVAPADGVIESMDLRPGDLVGANQPVARMLEPDQLWVRVYVPEPELGRVRIGQAAMLTVDTYPKREFPGKVVEIRTQSEYTPRNVQTLDQRMDQVFGVKVAIDRAPELKPGMAATVRLVGSES